MSSTPRLRWALLLLLLLSGGVWLGLSGCATWEIEPPATVKEAAEIRVTRYARHTRLTLPVGSGTGAVEYGFGDWHWYGRQEQGPWSAVRAILLPSDAALSRREVPGEFIAAGQPAGHFAILTVEAARVRVLHRELERRWQSLNEAESTHRGGSTYRRTSEAYHLFNTSNAKAAQWLRALGCEIHGQPIGGAFVVRNGEIASP